MRGPASMAFAAKVAVIPVCLATAAAAFIHSASETEAYWASSLPSGHFGLDAHIAGELADRGFVAEMAEAQDQASSEGEFPKISPSLLQLARETFAVDPLRVSLLRTIALGSVLHDDESRAREVMQLIPKISRRDTISDLWLAQDYGRAGETEFMIASFDHALRTSRRAREYAMKPVVDALASSETFAVLGDLLAKHPEWEEDFWRELSSNPTGITHAADFLSTTRIPIEQVPSVVRKRLYENLKKAGEYEALYRLALLDSEAGSTRSTLAQGGFVTVDEGNPLGWTLHSQGNFAARVHRRTQELQIDAQSGAFGLAADRVVRGDERIRLTVEMVDPVPNEASVWLAAVCTDDSNRELARLPMSPGQTFATTQFSSVGCAFVSLRLTFSVEPGRGGALFRFAKISLESV